MMLDHKSEVNIIHIHTSIHNVVKRYRSGLFCTTNKWRSNFLYVVVVVVFGVVLVARILVLTVVFYCLFLTTRYLPTYLPPCLPSKDEMKWKKK